MKLYRYRHADSRAFSEIVSRKAWHSRLDLLNDPFEGSYVNNSGLEDIDHLQSQLRVCCFSAKRDILLQWAHYADNHRGICLEYDVPDEELRAMFMEVKYGKFQPVLNAVPRYPQGHLSEGYLKISIGDEVSRTFLTKSKHWEYEKEYRRFLICESGDSGKLAEIPGRLSAVYFGLRATEATKEILSRLLPDSSGIDLWQATLFQGG